VVSDILLEHFSEGNINAQYYSNLLKIYKKWKEYLPIFSPDITDEIKLKTTKKEIKLLAQLIRRLAQTGFTTSEIISETRYYVDILNNPSAEKQLRFIHLKIAFEKIFHSK
jgi:predicted AAA+ superfamily ATPase